jgi:hypothetical protein
MQQIISTDVTPTLYWVIAIAALCTMVFCVVFLRYREDIDNQEHLPDVGKMIPDDVDNELAKRVAIRFEDVAKKAMIWTDEDMINFANHCVQRYRTLGYIKAKKKTLHEWLIKNAST